MLFQAVAELPPSPQMLVATATSSEATLTDKKQVLVYGATGAQGLPIVKQLVADGFSVRGLGRPEQQDPLAGTGAQTVWADLDDAEAVARATAGSDAVVFILPLAFDVAQAERWTGTALRAAEKAGVKQFVFNTSVPVPDEEPGVAAIDLKVRAERLVKAADVPFVIVRPTIYLGNLTAPWAAPSIINDRTIAYPLPEDVAVSWISWEDTASFVSAAVRRPDLAGSAFDVGGERPLNGAALAEAFGSALGGSYQYAPIPLPGFEAGLSQALGPVVGREIAALYGWFADEGRTRLSVDTSQAAAILDITPTPYATWIKGQGWAAAALAPA